MSICGRASAVCNLALTVTRTPAYSSSSLIATAVIESRSKDHAIVCRSAQNFSDDTSHMLGIVVEVESGNVDVARRSAVVERSEEDSAFEDELVTVVARSESDENPIEHMQLDLGLGCRPLSRACALNAL